MYDFVQLSFAFVTMRRTVQSVTAERTAKRYTPVKNPARFMAYGKPDKVFRTARIKQNDRRIYRWSLEERKEEPTSARAWDKGQRLRTSSEDGVSHVRYRSPHST
jgi:hypothetical protein